MAGDTSIEWCDKVWNPIVGCSIVSPGCTNCYAMKMAGRWRLKSDSIYSGLTKPSHGGPVWNGKLGLAGEQTLAVPLRWRRPQRIFVNSMGDLFHKDAPDEWIDRVFAVMALATQHIFIVLTKRPQRMREYISTWFERLGTRETIVDHPTGRTTFDRLVDFSVLPAILPNVWLGVSAERQQEADERVPDLLATPAAVRFVSAEPLLGPIDFFKIKEETGQTFNALINKVGISFRGIRLDQIIIGAESGPRARPMEEQWARDIIEQCRFTGVAAFMKQFSGAGGHAIKDTALFPEDLRIREFPGARL